MEHWRIIITAISLILAATAFFVLNDGQFSSTQPSEARGQAFNAADGLTYNTGTGLEVSISPIQEDQQMQLTVDKPQVPGELRNRPFEIQSLYDLNVRSDDSPIRHGEIALTFNIPANLRGTYVAILQKKQGEWRLANNKDGIPGGTISEDGKQITVVRDQLSKYALARWTYSKILRHINKLPQPPPIPPKVSTQEPQLNQQNRPVVEATVESPTTLKALPGPGLGGMFYDVRVVKAQNVHSIAAYGKTHSLNQGSARLGWHHPGEDNDLAFTFQQTGGSAELILEMNERALGRAAYDWASRLGAPQKHADLLVDIVERFARQDTVAFKDLVWTIARLLIKAFWEIVGSTAEFLANVIPVSVDMSTVVNAYVDGRTSHRFTISAEGTSSGNKAPTAAITAPSDGATFKVGETISFDGSSSSDPDGHVTKWHWDFDDGSTRSSETISHTYNSAGDFTATLKVTDDDGATDTATKMLTVQNRSTTSVVKETGIVNAGQVGKWAPGIYRDSTGRISILYETSAPDFEPKDLIHAYSDDDGETWATQEVVTIPNSKEGGAIALSGNSNDDLIATFGISWAGSGISDGTLVYNRSSNTWTVKDLPDNDARSHSLNVGSDNGVHILYRHRASVLRHRKYTGTWGSATDIDNFRYVGVRDLAVATSGANPDLYALVQNSYSSGDSSLRLYRRERGTWSCTIWTDKDRAGGNRHFVNILGNKVLITNTTGESDHTIEYNVYDRNTSTFSGWTVLKSSPEIDYTAWGLASDHNNNAHLIYTKQNGTNSTLYHATFDGINWNVDNQLTTSSDGYVTRATIKRQAFHHNRPNVLDIAILVGDSAPYTLKYVQADASASSASNQSPIADAGADQSVTDTNGDGRESVTLDGSGSSDPDGSIVSYTWTTNGKKLATGKTPNVFLKTGNHTITLTVKDDDGAKVTSEVAVIVKNASSKQPSGKIYWTSGGFDSRGKIQRANLDGSNVEMLVFNLGAPSSLDLDREAGKLYWVDTSSDSKGSAYIKRANLDGSNIENLFTVSVSIGLGLALDMKADKIYWIGTSKGKIQRANLDGSNVEDLVTEVKFPEGLALDVNAGKMYWTSMSKIQRANLDGSNIEDLVTKNELTAKNTDPESLALDVAAGKMYWTNRSKIQRANLDGSTVEDVVTGINFPSGIALDVSKGKIYWTTNGRKIQQANLDGSNVETLLSVDKGPFGIALK